MLPAHSQDTRKPALCARCPALSACCPRAPLSARPAPALCARCPALCARCPRSLRALPRSLCALPRSLRVLPRSLRLLPRSLRAIPRSQRATPNSLNSLALFIWMVVCAVAFRVLTRIDWPNARDGHMGKWVNGRVICQNLICGGISALSGAWHEPLRSGRRVPRSENRGATRYQSELSSTRPL